MKQKDILLIFITGFILVVIWIGFNIYHNLVNSTISETLGIQIAPIIGSFDTNAITMLKNRKQQLPIYELQPSASISATIVPTVRPTNIPVVVSPTRPASSSAQGSL